MNLKLLRKRLSYKEIAVACFFIILSYIYIYMCVLYPYKWQRTYFKLEQIYAENNVICNDGAPLWMYEFLEKNIKDNKILANQLIYITKQKVIYHCESPAGIEDINHVNIKTLFRYGSNTKPITAAYILKLVKEHKVNLDTNLSEIFPELNNEKIKDPRILKITIKNLLQHSSGFDRMLSKDAMFEEDRKPWCPYHIDKLKETKLDFNPGSYNAYDNRNSCLLGVVIERIEGKRYREVINHEFNLKNRSISFLDGPYIKNEVKYNFLYNEYRFEDYFKKFDFYALSSSAGLIGNAKSLALLLNNIIEDEKYSKFISFNKEDISCNYEKERECFNYSMNVIERNNNFIQFKYGTLPSASSFSLINKNKEIVVWMGNAERLDLGFKFENFMADKL